jgi:hypothetical protein
MRRSKSDRASTADLKEAKAVLDQLQASRNNNIGDKLSL